MKKGNRVLREESLSARRGWTLIEMLVVIGIMSVLLALSSQSLKSPKDSNKVTMACGLISGVFREAGVVARTYNRPVRVLVHNDASEADRYLRCLGIEVMDTDSNGQTIWTPVGKGNLLPEQIKVFPEYLNVASGSDMEGAMAVVVQSSFPKSEGASPKQWLSFNVNSRGIFQQVGRILVVGPVQGDDAAASVAKRRGVVISKSGTPLDLDTLPPL